MNHDNSFNTPEIPKEEIRSHKKTFSRISFAICAFILSYEVAALLFSYIISWLKIDTPFIGSGLFLMTLNALCIYGVGTPVICLAIHKAEPQTPAKSKMKFSTLFGIFAVIIMFTEVGSLISSYLTSAIQMITGNSVTDSTSAIISGTEWYVTLFFVGILGPIFEELIFRKIILSRLLPFGQLTAVLFSAGAFALFHGNLYQIFYAFAFGAVCGYVFVKTGKLIYTILLHMAVNIFCSAIPMLLQSLIDSTALENYLETGSLLSSGIDVGSILGLMLLNVYSIAILGVAIYGIVYLSLNIKNIRFEKGNIYIPSKNTGEIIFFNAGTITLTVICTVIIGMNTFM